MDETEMMEKTAPSPATAMIVETMVMTVQMALTELPVKMDRTETMVFQFFHLCLRFHLRLHVLLHLRLRLAQRAASGER